jgi:hypothetical protein
MDAFGIFGITRLSARVYDLGKSGVVIESQWVEKNGSRFKRYRVVK